MANSSVQDLLAALQKTKLSFGNSDQMSMDQLGAEDQLRGVMSPDYSPLEPIKQAHMSQIAQIAAMDQKLAGAYASPNSPLYIENPMKRESLVGSASNRGYKVASSLADEGQRVKKQITQDFEQSIDKAVSLYRTLTTLQSKEEARAEKASKAALSSIKKQKNKTGQEILDDLGLPLSINDEAGKIILNDPRFSSKALRQLGNDIDYADPDRKGDYSREALENWIARYDEQYGEGGDLFGTS